MLGGWSEGSVKADKLGSLRLPGAVLQASPRGKNKGKTPQMGVMEVDVIPTMQARLRPQLN